MRKLTYFKTKSLGTMILGFFVFSVASVHAQTSSFGKGRNWEEEPATEKVGTKKKKVRSDEDDRSDISPFSPGSNNISLDIGQVFLLGSVNGRYNDNLGFRLDYNYGVSDLFCFNSNFGYSEHGNGALSIGYLNAGLRMNLNWYDKIIPYTNFGLGFYRVGQGFPPPDNGVSSLSFGIYLGVGVDLQITKKIFFGASLQYDNVFASTKQLTTGPVSVGAVFMPFMLHLGMTF